jgi:hypothetical protein
MASHHKSLEASSVKVQDDSAAEGVRRIQFFDQLKDVLKPVRKFSETATFAVKNFALLRSIYHDQFLLYLEDMRTKGTNPMPEPTFYRQQVCTWYREPSLRPATISASDFTLLKAEVDNIIEKGAGVDMDHQDINGEMPFEQRKFLRERQERAKYVNSLAC